MFNKIHLHLFFFKDFQLDKKISITINSENQEISLYDPRISDTIIFFCAIFDYSLKDPNNKEFKIINGNTIDVYVNAPISELILFSRERNKKIFKMPRKVYNVYNLLEFYDCYNIYDYDYIIESERLIIYVEHL